MEALLELTPLKKEAMMVIDHTKRKHLKNFSNWCNLDI